MRSPRQASQTYNSRLTLDNFDIARLHSESYPKDVEIKNNSTNKMPIIFRLAISENEAGNVIFVKLIIIQSANVGMSH